MKRALRSTTSALAVVGARSRRIRPGRLAADQARGAGRGQRHDRLDAARHHRRVQDRDRLLRARPPTANEHGFNVEVISRSPATHTAFADQVAIIEDMIQRQVDVIAISPTEVEVVKPALAQANAAGIPVIIVNLLEPIEGAEVASYIGFDNTLAAKVTAYAVLDYFGGPGVLGAGDKVEVKPEDYLDLAFWEGLYGGLSDEQKAGDQGARLDHRGRRRRLLLDRPRERLPRGGRPVPGHRDRRQYLRRRLEPREGHACAEDFLQANPEGLDFIWAASNEMGLGAMLASEAAGRLETAEAGPTVGDNTVAVFTNDVTPESVDRIAEGKMIAETTHGFADWGWFGTAFAVQLACGVETAATFDIRPRIAYRDNARQFYPEPALPEINWDEIRANCKKAG